MRNSSRRMMPVLLLVAALMILVGTVSVSAQGGVIESDAPIALPGVAPTPAATQPDATQAGEVYGIAASGSYAYLGQGNKLVIVNVSNPASPTFAGQTGDLGGTVFDIAISGSYAYVVTGGGALKVVNISNPASPAVIASHDTRGSAEGIAISGNYAYVTDNAGLLVINISNPAAPARTATFSTPTPNTTSVVLSGSYAYVVDAISSRFYIINVSNPASPGLAGTYSTSGWPGDVAVSGNYAHVMTWAPYVVHILNISNPASITKVGEYPYAGTKGLSVIGNYSYVSEGDALRIVNVANPYFPTLTGTFSPLDNAWDMVVNGSYAYTSEKSGMSIINISNPAAPNRVGFFSTSVPPDTTAPEVTWVAPVSPHVAFDAYGEIVTLKANATDNRGVTKVQFDWWDDTAQQRVLIGEDTTAPYEVNLDTNSLRPGCHYVNAGAFDAAGNFREDYIFICLNPPPAPSLNAIANSDQDGTYTVSWSTVNGATGYSLEEQFSSGSWQAVSGVSGTSHGFTGKSAGAWCYRAAANNNAGAGAWSASQCTTVNAPTSFPNTFYISPSNNKKIGNIAAASADILRYEKSTNTWTMIYDGSVRGTTKNVSAFDIMDDGSLLLVFSANQKLTIDGTSQTATPYDVVRFTPYNPNVFPLGGGTYEWYFRGKTHDLSTGAEKIDAIDKVGNRLLLSTTGTAKITVSGVSTTVTKEDVFAYNLNSGQWESTPVIDGSAIPELKGKNISSVWDDPNSNDYYVTVTGAFKIGGVKGSVKSIVKLTPNGAGFTPSFVDWLAPGVKFPSNLDGLDIAP